MTQLSRPLQVALAAAGLLAVVWFVALRGHSSSSEPPATTATHSASAPSSSSSNGGSSSGTYHGSAPGVEGLTRDIHKAHAAAAQSEQNAAKLKQRATQVSGERAAAAGGATSASGASATHAPAAPSAAKARAHAKSTTHTSTTHSAARTHAVSGISGQAWVEGQLGKKVTVALLFYTPRAYDDSRTRRELERLIGEERGSHAKIALRVAPANQVGVYGSFTRVASIYQTPTLLLVTPGGVVKPPITGLTDAFSIEQAIDEKT